MKKVFPIFLFVVLSFVVIGCSDDKNEPKEPSSHRVEGWEEVLHQSYVRTEGIYSCDQCHASPIYQRKDCVEGGCHSIVFENNKPSDHKINGQGDNYTVTHQILKDSAQVNNSKPYCVACHVPIKPNPKNCGCHAFSVAPLTQTETEKMGIGEPIFE